MLKKILLIQKNGSEEIFKKIIYIILYIYIYMYALKFNHISANTCAILTILIIKVLKNLIRQSICDLCIKIWFTVSLRYHW